MNHELGKARMCRFRLPAPSLAGWLAGGWVGGWVGRSVGRLVCWSISLLVYCSGGLLVGCLSDLGQLNQFGRQQFCQCRS